MAQLRARASARRFPFARVGLLRIAGAVFLVAALAACSQASTAATGPEPVDVEHTRVEGRNRVRLTQAAADRLKIDTVPVRARTIGGARRLLVPYSAVLYLPDGTTFVYRNPEPLLFVRTTVRVASVDGGTAILTTGPSAGTAVVSVGAAELLGSELGIGS